MIYKVPEKSLMETIGTSNLSELAIDAGELAVDALLSDGLLRDIPVINTVISLAKTGFAIKDYLFLRKLISFLQHLEDTPTEKRRKFVNQLESSKLREQIGQNLILLIERLDDMNKPEILGRIFKAYVEKRIDYLTFQRLCTAVDRIKYYNISALQQYYSHGDESLLADETLQDLVNCGLVAMNLELHTIDGQDTAYSRNELGSLFIEIVLAEEG